MLTDSPIGLIRRRNASGRPYEGSTNESLHHKLECSAVTAAAKELIRAELVHRTDYGSPKVFDPRGR